MLTVDQLRFSYDESVLFDGLSLAVERGGVTALVGANGAGKSTLMNCIAGLIRPFAGEIRVDGMPLAQDVNAVRRVLGYLPDNFGLFPALTARRHLQYVAAAHGLADAAAAMDSAAAATDLAALMDKTPDAMSRGQRQRLGIAMTLLHKPRFLMLDEPASGLDPPARQALSALIKTLQADGATLLVSSHILTELRDYATDYLIMDGGRIVAAGSLTAAAEWRVAFADGASAEALQRAKGILAESASDVSARDGCLYFCLAPEADSSALLRSLVSASLPVAEFSRVGADIEHIYRASVTSAAAA